MYTKQEIILQYSREGKSQRKISRELGINRLTVKKYLAQITQEGHNNQSHEQAHSQCLREPPCYDSIRRTKLRLTREVQEVIDGLLRANERKRGTGLHKQVLKKADILEVLHTQGIEIGYTTVCNYIREREGKLTAKEAFIRQSYQPGSACEFDWGEVKIQIGGKQQRYYLAVFTSSYSNYRYARLYYRQDTLAFMESHVSFFEYTQGHVYKEIVYDNMRVAVSKFVGKHEKEPTAALLQIKGHYHFSHRFCNFYRGNEKGHVERSVEYVRRKSFALKDDFEDEDQAQQHLLNIIDKLNDTRQQLSAKTAREMFLEEKQMMPVVTTRLSCSDLEQLRIDKYATFSYCTNRYSVPDHLVGYFVDAKIFSNKIEVYYDNKLLATHDRSYNKHHWVISIEHYLDTFRRKPGALAGSTALVSSKYLKQLYETYFREVPQDFIDLLHYCYQHQVEHENLEATVCRLMECCGQHITTEKIKALLGNKPAYSPVILPDTQTTSMAKEQLMQAASLLN
jgi:transposase/DNA-binding CsgD family transcriptional regulator